MGKTYKYTGDGSFEDAYHDCRLVDESIVDDESFQEADKGLVLYYMDRILEALKKQVPEEPKRENKCRYCKTCGKILAKRYYTYCPHCGQKVKKSFKGGEPDGRE